MTIQDCTHWSKVHCWHERPTSIAAGLFAFELDVSYRYCCQCGQRKEVYPTLMKDESAKHGPYYERPITPV